MKGMSPEQAIGILQSMADDYLNDLKDRHPTAAKSLMINANAALGSLRAVVASGAAMPPDGQEPDTENADDTAT